MNMIKCLRAPGKTPYFSVGWKFSGPRGRKFESCHPDFSKIPSKQGNLLPAGRTAVRCFSRGQNGSFRFSPAKENRTMPKVINNGVPAYRLHKQSGQAICT